MPNNWLRCMDGWISLSNSSQLFPIFNLIVMCFGEAESVRKWNFKCQNLKVSELKYVRFVTYLSVVLLNVTKYNKIYNNKAQRYSNSVEAMLRNMLTQSSPKSNPFYICLNYFMNFSNLGQRKSDFINSHIFFQKILAFKKLSQNIWHSQKPCVYDFLNSDTLLFFKFWHFVIFEFFLKFWHFVIFEFFFKFWHFVIFEFFFILTLCYLWGFF